MYCRHAAIYGFFCSVFKWKPRVWVVGFGLVDSLALVPFNLHISFHLFYLVFYSWINPQTFGTRLKWSWLNKTPIFDHFPVDSTSHLHTLYCKRFVRLRVLIKTHITYIFIDVVHFVTVVRLWRRIISQSLNQSIKQTLVAKILYQNISQ